MNQEETGSSGEFLFAGFRFDRANGDLLRLDPAGEQTPVSIGSRATALLSLLVARHGRLVSKDEIMDAVWRGTTVEEANLTVQVSMLRRILDRDPTGDSAIQTVPGRGYRFVARIERPAPSSPDAPPLPDKPSLAVLPFLNISGDPEQAYFADGMVEEIITALSRIGWLFVIARNSSFTYRGRPVDVKQVGGELGVRYVLEGSVRKSSDRVRISAQLIEAETGAHLWADRFDSPLEDVFDMQDKIASCVAGVIEPALQAAETRRSGARPTNDLTAYDFYLRGYPLIIGSEKIPEALDLLERAIARDPSYGPALALAAVCCMRLAGELTDPRPTRRKGIELARRGVQAAGDDAGTLANAAFALASFGEDLDAMTALVDRALTFNPNYARGWHISSFLRLWAGQLNAAIAHAETALRLSPRGQVNGPLYVIGSALLCGRRFDEAIAKLRVAVHGSPNFPGPHRALASCYAHLGRSDEAREIVARLRSISPVVIPSRLPFRHPEHRELYVSGLRLAMGEEQ